MKQFIKAVKLDKPHQVSIQETQFPVKKENEVLIKVESVGICGSDIGAYRGTNPLVTYPRILGHEVVGRIIESGLGMPSNIKIGDRVIVDPYIYCGSCYPCSIGRTNCCTNLKVIGVHIDGGMQEIITHPAHLITKVPNNIPLNLLPLAEPLTIALHAIHRTKVKQGEFVTIIGAGAIGLMAALVSKLYGATPILIDILDKRLEYAKSIGVTHTINSLKEDPQEQINKITNSQLSQVVIEASGANESIQNTLKYTSFAGRIALTGWPKKETLLPTNIITFKELDIYGSRTSKGEFEEALNLISSGKFDAKDIVTKTISFDEIPEYIGKLSNEPDNYLKINAVL
ncbi:zinc-binding alcohol dehydrogenase family protein [Gallibacterium anatis]|uniref:zinc-binding alcohol dehydrogenase family protein n=1 Tax=Gallibacterium anatis TaxID=750 RepID=UPI0005321BAB|nr:zinc-binding alcohol dehydrogenase family protein [Gallibacterium anatis]KGQ25413.1 alcohol dehydrogenase [Gallibacterium anatis]KGQ41411.1 alcohol dehydrogenase [Gallibacterium anatis IPDH697-78]MDK9560825.1 zinc-binding alcohol dehydrogenase family protein [Gallibacterium anatis]OZN50149.1 alcohol dehydrogenase [Gallibacterium anatis]WAX70635.1 zinc-binding alcohol dehydrogenase family protein [Gallibacterium anatis]